MPNIEDESEPLPAIRSVEQARTAAQGILDWADWNLSGTEASDMNVVRARAAYDAAKVLIAALAIRQAHG